MKITPVEIRNQEFKRSMRGYDTIEVDTFLELIANDYTTVIQQNEDLKNQLMKLETELKNFKEVEKTLKQTLYNVQETSQLSKENSQKAAVLVKREAELAASQMIERARVEVNKMREEMTSLRTQKQSFISRLKHVLGSQIELIEILQMDDLDVMKLKDKTKKNVNTVDVPKPRTVPVAPAVKMPVPQETKKPIRPPTLRINETKKPSMDDFFQDIFGEDDKK